MAVDLKLGTRTVKTVFDLVGESENDLTAALGWALSKGDGFADALIADVFGHPAGEILSVSLQRFGPDGGYTDVEVVAQKAHLVIEAKKGWAVADEVQLARYANRPAGLESRLLSVSAASRQWAAKHLKPQVGGVQVEHRSWGDMSQLASVTSTQGGLASRRMLRELAIYLKGASRMLAVSSNWAYCVVLGRGAVEGTSLDWMDIPLKHHKYFHPFGRGGWTPDPPNYMAFRWDGRVRQFNHVEKVTVVDDAAEVLPSLLPAGLITGPHYAYDLGPAVQLPSPLKNGAIYATARVWAMIDLLFTASDLKEATVASQARRAAVGEPLEPLQGVDT